MKILLIRKPSNFELHGERVRAIIESGGLPEEVLQGMAVAHKEHYSTLDLLKKMLEKNDIHYEEIIRDSDWPEKIDFDYYVTIGGDGTLLSASRNLDKECETDRD